MLIPENQIYSGVSEIVESWVRLDRNLKLEDLTWSVYFVLDCVLLLLVLSTRLARSEIALRFGVPFGVLREVIEPRLDVGSCTSIKVGSGGRLGCEESSLEC